MSDEADKTSDREELQQRLMYEEREAFRPAVAEHCYECDISIPKERQEATGGTDMCITCASAQEHRAKGYR